MKEIVWRVKKGWIYLVGITLMIGFSALAYGEIDIKAAKDSREVPKQVSQDSEALLSGDVKGAPTGAGAISNSAPATTKPEEKKTKTKTIYKTVTVEQSKTVTSASNIVPATTTTKPPIKKDTATLVIRGVGRYDVEVKANDTVLQVMERAGSENGFTIDYVPDEGYGVFMTRIGSVGYSSSLRFNSPDGKWWMFYDLDNPAHLYMSASSDKVYNRDIIEWRYE